MTTGYPRFFVARVVDRLAMLLLEIKRAHQRATPDDDSGVVSLVRRGERLATVLDNIRHGQMCRNTLLKWCAEAEPSFVPNIEVDIVSWDGEITAVLENDIRQITSTPRNIGGEEIVLISYPADLAGKAKAFWQHTGFGISSRRATHWVEDAPFLSPSTQPKQNPVPLDVPKRIEQAKAVLESRIASSQSTTTLPVPPSDVFLFPTGMTALSEVASAILSLRKARPSNPYRVVIFG